MGRDGLLGAGGDHEIDDDENCNEGDGEGDSADKPPAGADAALLDSLVHNVEMPECEKSDEPAEGDHRCANRKGHACGVGESLLLELRGEFAQPDSEFCHDEPETDDGNTCAYPRQKSPL